MHDGYEYEYILTKYLFPELMREINSDKDPGNRLGSQLEARGILYTSLLENYTNITNVRNILKEIHKWLFFWAIIGVGGIITIAGVLIILKVLSYEDERMFLDSLPILITTFVSFLSVIIGVPLTITNFLFNVEEDKNITSTIHATQKHDYKEIQLLKDRYTGKKTQLNQATPHSSAAGDSKRIIQLHNEQDVKNAFIVTEDSNDEYFSMK